MKNIKKIICSAFCGLTIATMFAIHSGAITSCDFSSLYVPKNGDGHTMISMTRGGNLQQASVNVSSVYPTSNATDNYTKVRVLFADSSYNSITSEKTLTETGSSYSPTIFYYTTNISYGATVRACFTGNSPNVDAYADGDVCTAIYLI